MVSSPLGNPSPLLPGRSVRVRHDIGSLRSLFLWQRHNHPDRQPRRFVGQPRAFNHITRLVQEKTKSAATEPVPVLAKDGPERTGTLWARGTGTPAPTRFPFGLFGSPNQDRFCLKILIARTFFIMRRKCFLSAALKAGRPRDFDLLATADRTSDNMVHVKHDLYLAVCNKFESFFYARNSTARKRHRDVECHSEFGRIILAGLQRHRWRLKHRQRGR